MALNDLAIKGLKPKSKPYKKGDSGGLYILVTPAGGKLWRMKYRIDGKEKVLSFGAYPDVSLLEAREERDKARKDIAKDKDPSELNKAEKAEKIANKTNTFELWADKWWQKWHVDKSDRHAAYVKRRLEVDVYPLIGDRPIKDISAYEIVDAIKAIAERGALDIAKRAHQTIGQVFRYAIAHGKESKATRNPAIEIRPSDIIETRKKVNYARVDIRELPALLRAIDNSEARVVTRIAIKLIALTFVRTTELIEAKWDEFDFEAMQWRIPANRMKMKSPHIVPLSKQALELLHDLKSLSSYSEYLFPNQYNHTKPMSNNTILKLLERMGYKGKMTGHGFRGVASTSLHEQGYDHQHIEIQLAHGARDDVSAAYNHALYISQRTSMMQDWADYIDELKAGAKVLPFKQV
ncbi:MAG TPA: tyrosine-type recombinase/integrase [Methylotenera sp.]|nr:tyrosine-type recombinase/integrase [Methylotenera sp.]HPH06897.1 tyrosine-type recombinase/integrase [Methylotenera sp.]HPM48737.1 tyrosine-type recombinase/integrase [Methylotenera sp.]